MAELSKGQPLASLAFLLWFVYIGEIDGVKRNTLFSEFIRQCFWFLVLNNPVTRFLSFPNSVLLPTIKKRGMFGVQLLNNMYYWEK